MKPPEEAVAYSQQQFALSEELLTLATHDIENMAEESIIITNPMSARTGHKSNLDLHMINNVRLAEIDEHI